MDHLIAVNSEIETTFHRYGVPPARTSVIEPHTDVARSDAALPEALEAFARDHSPLLVSVGGLETEYRVPLQIEAMPAVRALFPRAGLVVVGSGSLDTDLRSQASGSSCASHIMLSGDLAHSATLSLIERAGVVLRTTDYDGDSLAVRESLALGTPVIASDNGMRPAGVHLLSALNAEALAGLVSQVLAGARPGGIPINAPGAGNLQRVLDLYRSLADGAR
jgi:glycosyltransferase involved in cell wall biosynthesis